MFSVSLPRVFAGSIRPLTLSLVLLFAVSLVTGSDAADWKGQKIEKDGVITMVNPSDPMEGPLTVDLKEQWRLGGDTDAEDEFFGVISRVTTDKAGNIYLLDSQLTEVKIFSPDGEFIRSIGREGEGPGEFRIPQDMFLLPDGNVGVLQLAPGRIVMLTPEGDPVGEHPLPQNEDGSPMILIGGQLMNDQLVLVAQSNKMGEGKLDIYRYLTMVDADGKELKRLHTETRTIEFANAVMDEKVWSTFDRRWQVGPKGKLYAVTSFPDYEIKVWDQEGNLEKLITQPDYKHLPRSQEEKDRVHGIFEAFTRQIPGATIKVSNDDQDVAAIYPRPDGSLWVMTSRGFRERPEGSMGMFDVYDSQGEFVRRVTLNGEGDPLQDGYFFVDDRLYVVTGFLDAAMAAQGGAVESDDDDGEEPAPMAVICYKLDVPDMGM